MKEVAENIFVGDEKDYEALTQEQKDDWHIVQACKVPYHKEAVGHKGYACPKEHPEYLIARRGNRLILNMIDAPKPEYIPKEIVDAALAHILDGAIIEGKKTLIHCNQGHSRSAGLALLFLAKNNYIANGSYEAAAEVFLTLYPDYAPGKGIEGFLQQNWSEYVS